MGSSRIHEWIKIYNWDDGLASIQGVAISSATEYATALLIYWRLGGPWLESEPTSDVNVEAKRLQQTVRERLLAGLYPMRPNVFDPTAELSRAQVYQLRKQGLPELLLGRGSTGPR